MAMQHQFSAIPKANIPRSSFKRNHSYKTTFDSGYLVPIFVDEALPGDTFNLTANLLARLATPITPVMDNIYLDTFFFAVPMRLVWDNWQRFNGEQKNPGDSTDFIVPYISNTSSGRFSFSVGSLADYFGLPTGINFRDSGEHISCLFHRAYKLIWNEWFRDQNLQDSLEINLGDGPDDCSTDLPLKRCKRHDYFTSCLPWPQKGPGVELPLGGVAPVLPYRLGSEWPASDNGGYTSLVNTVGGSVLHPYPLVGFWKTNSTAERDELGVYNYGNVSTINNDAGNEPSVAPVDGRFLMADLSNATAATINSLRMAFQMQRLYEADARGGTRYTEILRSHFGVISPDGRLQRPEYLGGMSEPIMINPVVQQSATSDVSPQGNLSAFGVGANRSGFVKSFTEHTIIIGLVNVRADLTYQQGIPRMFSRQTRFDFYWPTLAHLGEQAVFNKEIYASGNVSENNDVFGYQERWAEYRYKPSQITGRFRSTDAQSLDVWHLSQKFDALPRLNSEFIEENPPIDRIIAVQDEPQFLLDVYFNLNCVRPMPVYSTPGLIDHF